MNTTSFRSRVVNGALWLFATKAIGQAVAWVLTLVVMRLLSPQDYGLVGMALLFTGFLVLFNDLGLGAAIIKNRELDPEDLGNIRWAVLLINTGLFAAVMLSAPLVAAYFGEPGLVAITRTLGFAFLLNGLGSPSGYLLARQLLFRKKSQAELFGSLAGGVSTVTLAAAGFGAWSLVAGVLAQQFTTNVLYCVYQPFSLPLRFSVRRIRQSIHFGAQVALASILWYISSNADYAVVGKVLGTIQLGYYTLAFQFSSLPIEKIVSLLIQIAFPCFSAVQDDPERQRQLYLRFVGTIALLTFPMFMGLLLVADSGFGLFLTDKWAPAILPLKILCVVACLRAVEAMNAPVVFARGRPRIVLLNNLLQAIALPAAFYVGGRYGLPGVAIAWLVAWPILYAVITRMTLRLIDMPVRRYVAALAHPFLASGLMVGAVTVVQKTLLRPAPRQVDLVVTVALGCAVYGGYMMMFNRNAIREARSLLRRDAGSPSGPAPAAEAAPAMGGAVSVFPGEV